MKNLACAIALTSAVAAAPLHASGPTQPMVEPEVVVADTVDNSQDVGQLIIPLMLLMIIVGMGYSG